MKRFTVPLLLAIAVVAGMTAVGAFAFTPESLAALPVALDPNALAIAVLGETSLVEVKKLIDTIGEAHEQYKKTNDERLKALAEQKAVAEHEVKLAKLDEAMNKAQAAIDEIMKKAARDKLTAKPSDKDRDFAQECKMFNAARATREGVGAHADVDVDAMKAYEAALFKALRSPNSLSGDETKALQAGVDSDGGYLLPPATRGRVIAKIYELSPMRQICTVQPISTNALEGLIDNDEATFGWVGEVGARSTTATPTVGAWKLEAFEWYAAPKVTQRMLDDAAVDIEGWLANKIANKIARGEADAFINGDGAKQPRGIATYTMAETADATRAWGQIEKVKTGTSADFGTYPFDNLTDVIQALKPGYQQAARFLTRREVITKLRKAKDSTARPLWEPSLQVGVPDRILGYPVTIAQDMPTLASGSASLAFGNFAEAYTIVDRLGMRTLRDPFTAKPYVVFYSTGRVGGGVLNFEAVKFLTFNT